MFADYELNPIPELDRNFLGFGLCDTHYGQVLFSQACSIVNIKS